MITSVEHFFGMNGDARLEREQMMIKNVIDVKSFITTQLKNLICIAKKFN